MISILPVNFVGETYYAAWLYFGLSLAIAILAACRTGVRQAVTLFIASGGAGRAFAAASAAKAEASSEAIRMFDGLKRLLKRPSGRTSASHSRPWSQGSTRHARYPVRAARTGGIPAQT